VIARIMGEGQFEIDEALLDRLDELDEDATGALERDDKRELDRCLQEMAAIVRGEGTPILESSLAPSDVVIPPADLTLEETRRLLSDDGFIPSAPIEEESA
jgi:hypothetical protein